METPKEVRELEDRQIEAAFELAYAAEMYVHAHREILGDEAAGCETANALVHAANVFGQRDGELLEALEIETFAEIVAPLEGSGEAES